MDAIEQLDWGIYSHFDFDFQNQQTPWLLWLMLGGYYLGSYVCSGIALIVAIVIFVIQGKRVSALVAFCSAVLAIGLILACRLLVPRARPPKSLETQLVDEAAGSYPSASVLLFMLAAMLLGFALWGLSARAWLRGTYAMLATALTVWVCMSQFVLPLHFFTDVLGSIAAAGMLGWLAFLFIARDRLPEAGPVMRRETAAAIQDLSQAREIQEK